MTMRCVVLESPLAGDVAANVAYARACARDCLLRGDAPFASHLLYAQEGILDDLSPEERKIGMRAGFAWVVRGEASCVYLDRGLSSGMVSGIARAEAAGVPVEWRTLRGESVRGSTEVSYRGAGLLAIDDDAVRRMLRDRDVRFVFRD
jgi:hypothetical protein